MKLQDLTSPLELLTDRIIIARDIPYLNDANSPAQLNCEHSVNVVSKISIPGEEAEIKKILNIDNTIELTYQFNVKVILHTNDKNVQLYSAYCEIIQILTYDPEHYQVIIANNSAMLGEFISGSGLSTAWTRWRAQINTFIAAAQLPVPVIPSMPPAHLAERLV